MNDRTMKGIIPGLNHKEIVNVPLVVYIDAEGNMTDALDKRDGVTRHVIGEAVVHGDEVSMTLADRGMADNVLDNLLAHPQAASFGLSFSEQQKLVLPSPSQELMGDIFDSDVWTENA